MIRSVLFASLGVFIVTPAFAQSAAERQLAADVRILEQRTERIEGRIAELAETTQSLGSQVAETANASRKLFADQMAVLREALTAVGVLREQLAVTNHRLVAMIEQSAAPPGATQLFQSAMGDYMAGNYGLAVKGFTAYLEASPSAGNAPLAWYYIGEAYHRDNQLDQALVAYEHVIAEHAASEQVPNARLRRGEVLSQLGRVKEAAADFELILKSSPDTEAAILARQRLAALRQ
jgi:TolA-binding protein